MKQLIINADDFGLHPSINEGIIEGYTKGLITSTTLMAGAPYFDDAIRLAKAHPRLGVGVHLTRVAAEPVADPDTIPTLLDDNRQFYADYGAFIKRYGKGKVSMEEVRREFDAQIARVMESGIAITHFDSHQHLHVLPGIREVAIELAQKYQIHAMRCPAESPFFDGLAWQQVKRVIERDGLSFFAWMAKQKMKRAGILAPRAFWGMLYGGQMTEENLLRILPNLRDGVNEIMIHPGASNHVLRAAFPWQYHWEDEKNAVSSYKVKEYVQQHGIQMISFGEF